MPSPTCPVHPQCMVWHHAGTQRCAICGRLLVPPDAPRDLPFAHGPEPVVIRSFAVYREHAGRTDGGHDLQYYAGGLCGEAGEVWGQLKRHVYQAAPLDRDALCEELGDVLWFVDRLAQHLGLSLEEVAARNVAKLWVRYPDGYSAAASRARADKKK